MLSEPKFTKGPWYWQPGIGDETVLSPGILVAKGRITEEDTANAHLIAAAPEIESALRNLLSFTLFLFEDPSRGEDAKAIHEAHAALAKARGEG